MFFPDSEQKLEQNIAKTNISIQQLMIHMEGLDREIQELLGELHVTPQQLSVFIENEQNFTQENWSELQQQRKILDEKLMTFLSNVKDLRKTTKAHKERHVQNHWLFVK
jgi:chromosome segregation ATPase